MTDKLIPSLPFVKVLHALTREDAKNYAASADRDSFIAQILSRYQYPATSGYVASVTGHLEWILDQPVPAAQ
jgi:hypothetical protein